MDHRSFDIAVIGMSGRFPKAKDLGHFWENLRTGVEAISRFSEEELLSAGVSPALLHEPNYVRAGTVLEEAEFFDASFFGINPHEAELMDPQHRLFLECAYEALEDAGYDSQRYEGLVGVFAGAGRNTYLANVQTNSDLNGSVSVLQTTIANGNDFLATRVSYKLNLRGPSFAVQSACSTSLVAVHLACQSLLSGDCDIAMAGGVAVFFPQRKGYLYQEGGILSPDGHCRAFDAKARGMVVGRGVGVVVLKRLDEAIADRDCIHAVIKGSAINNDGSSKIGFTAPDIRGQFLAIRSAQIAAGIEADTISYVETHGTGTELGDPIEIAALTDAFRASTDKVGFCAIGSLKTNIGHADAAAGVAGLIKAVLALKHKELPASLHFERSNPKIDFVHSPFYVNPRLMGWEVGKRRRRAAVNAFGIGGTNAHVILEEAPELEVTSGSRPRQLVLLSAKTPTALNAASKNLAEHVKKHPDLNLADMAYTLQVGRRFLEYRRMLVCQNREDLLTCLESSDQHGIHDSRVEPHYRPVVFMFPGQGSQYVNMARELYESEFIFRDEVNRCCGLLAPHLGFDLQRILYPEKGREEEEAQRLQQTSVTQPALFVIEFALARLWMLWGIKPEALIGHSIGEYVAACLAGVFTLEDALALVVQRGRLMQNMPPGAMLAVPMPEDELRMILPPTLSLSAVNGPSLCVVSGRTPEVDAFLAALRASDKTGTMLHTSHAFHSEMMDAILRPFAECVCNVKRNHPTIPFISNLTGTWISAGDATNPEYWAKHLRNTVRFSDGVKELLKEPDRVLLEVGPGTTLCSLAKQQIKQPAQRTLLSSMRHPQERQFDLDVLLTTLGRLWLSGQEVDWSGFYAHERRRRISLPTYAFDRKRYWIEGRQGDSTKPAPACSTCKNPDVADWFYVPSWKRSAARQPIRTPARKENWLVFLDECGLGARIAKKLAQYSQDVVKVRPGVNFELAPDGDYVLNPSRREDYERLLDELQKQRKLPHRVAHFWSVTADLPTTQSEVESFHRYRSAGFDSLLFFGQALCKHGISDIMQVNLISNNVQEVIGGEILCPGKAILLGPCKVITQEHRNLICKSIDVDSGEFHTTGREGLVEQLAAELLSNDSEAVIAYRGIFRWVRGFEQVRLDESMEAKAKLRERGVYLITGGLGKIGLLLAQFLAKNYRARLILMGRSGLPRREAWVDWLDQHGPEDDISRRIQKVQELEKMGSDVMVLAANVADKEQVGAAISAAFQRFGEINGVFHGAGAAGRQGFSFIPDISKAECELHFQPKVYGLLVLEDVLRDKKLDFFVLMSSLSTVLGGLRFAAYSGANHFMDAFVQSRRRLSGIPWISVNWDGWRNDEASESSTLSATPAEFSLTPAEGIAACRRILGETAFSQIIVSTGDLNSRLDMSARYQPFESAAPSRPIETSPSHARPDLQTDYVPAQNETERLVASIWEGVLGIEKVGIHDDFFELGGHSLMGTQVLSRLRKVFGVELGLRSLYDTPTVAAMAETISKLKVEQDRSEEALLQQEIEGLNDDEVEAELARRGESGDGQIRKGVS